MEADVEPQSFFFLNVHGKTKEYLCFSKSTKYALTTFICVGDDGVMICACTFYNRCIKDLDSKT